MTEVWLGVARLVADWKGTGVLVGHAAAPARHDEKLFESLRRQAQERDVNLRTHVLVGHPAGRILKRAKPYRAALNVGRAR